MNKCLTRIWLCAVLVFSALPGSAAELPPQDAKAVRGVVQAQLAAMAAGDAAAAFSYASPAIRAQFGDANRFMAMVQHAYPMVIRPAATSYFRPEADSGVVVQDVLLRDATGQAWRASYQLEQQPDKRWRINGCVVTPDDGKSST
jgi:hypothetical protein